jgi:hypothetical protein
MSSSAIFVIGVVTVILLAIFTYETTHGISHARLGSYAGARHAGGSDIEAASMRPLKILLATDGSPCSDRAVQSVAIRPWGAGSQLELVSVIHTNVPFVPEPHPNRRRRL